MFVVTIKGFRYPGKSYCQTRFLFLIPTGQFCNFLYRSSRYWAFIQHIVIYYHHCTVHTLHTAELWFICYYLIVMSFILIYASLILLLISYCFVWKDFYSWHFTKAYNCKRYNVLLHCCLIYWRETFSIWHKLSFR